MDERVSTRVRRPASAQLSAGVGIDSGLILFNRRPGSGRSRPSGGGRRESAASAIQSARRSCSSEISTGIDHVCTTRGQVANEVPLRLVSEAQLLKPGRTVRRLEQSGYFSHQRE